MHRITGSIPECMEKIEKIDRDGHPRFARGCGEKPERYEDLREGETVTTNDFATREIYSH